MSRGVRRPTDPAGRSWHGWWRLGQVAGNPLPRPARDHGGYTPTLVMVVLPLRTMVTPARGRRARPPEGTLTRFKVIVTGIDWATSPFAAFTTAWAWARVVAWKV